MSEEKTIVYSRDGNIFYEDESLIDDAHEDWISGEPEDGGYYYGEKKEIDVVSLVSDSCIDDIMERMYEALYDIVGEFAEDALSITDEKKKELTKIIHQFIKENCSCSCWAVENVKYHSFCNNKTVCDCELAAPNGDEE